jgi:cephalosporin-C deacetylase-like acetyl esterase
MRHIGMIVCSLALVVAAAAQDSWQVTGGLSGMVDSYLTEVARQHWQARAQAVARISTPAQVKERQAYIRRKVLEAIGGFPAKTPLNARITGTLERDGYRIEKLIYESQPQFYVTANLYIPAAGKPPYPAIVGSAGHSTDGKAQNLYQSVWISLAKKGFVVLAWDPPGQGERYEYWDAAKNKPRFSNTTEHSTAGVQCLLTGGNYARYELWDAIRGVDYLLTRKEVDPKRLGAAGNSGGGTMTSYLLVVEPRLAAATPSCYLTSWEKLWAGPGPQDAEQDFAGFLKDELDFPDYLIAFAPKPVKMMTAIRDYFPIEGARATYAEAKRIFEVMGAGDRIGFFEYDDTHGWSQPRREATYAWLGKWLNNTPQDAGEPALKIEPDANLNCTPTGQLATSLKGRTVQSLNAEIADKMYPSRAASKITDPAKLRSLVSKRIGFEVSRGTPQVSQLGVVKREGHHVEKISIETEKGITVPALVFVPDAAAGRKQGVILINPTGKSADASPGGDIEALVSAGYVVMAPDLRGWGESVTIKGSSGYRAEFQTAMRAILVGKTMVGMQAADLLRCFDYMLSRPDVDAARISVIGKHNGGVVAMYAAAFEPRIRKVAAEDAAPSYVSIATSKEYPSDTIAIAVPGVLHDFDLPDLRKLIAPRALDLIDRSSGQAFRGAYGTWLAK